MSMRPNFHFALFLRKIWAIHATCGVARTQPQDAVEAKQKNEYFVLK